MFEYTVSPAFFVLFAVISCKWCHPSVLHPFPSYIWCLLVNEFTTAGTFDERTECVWVLRRNTTSASVWVNPYVHRASGAVLYQNEGESVNGEQTRWEQAVLLHNSRSGSPPRWARGQMAAEESERQRLSSVPLLGRCIVYLLKNKSDLAQAPPLISWSLAGRCFRSHLLGHS